MAFTFEKLIVYQKAIAFADRIRAPAAALGLRRPAMLAGTFNVPVGQYGRIKGVRYLFFVQVLFSVAGSKQLSVPSG